MSSSSPLVIRAGAAAHNFNDVTLMPGFLDVLPEEGLLMKVVAKDVGAETLMEQGRDSFNSVEKYMGPNFGIGATKSLLRNEVFVDLATQVSRLHGKGQELRIRR